MAKETKRILVTGALGQIGTDLIMELRNRYGADNVIASDCRPAPSDEFLHSGPFQQIDVLNIDSIENVIKNHNIDTVYHMAALLSAVGEKHPQQCWNVNMNGTINILDLALKHELAKVVIPSSIAVWGPGVPLEKTPQETVLKPTTMYGVTKVCGELVCDYYVNRFGLDVRGLRYPGIISYQTLPGGGTTDYAVAIYYDAVDKGKYTCFVNDTTRLPMLYMPDAINGTIQLANADGNRLKHHSDFNLNSMSFTVPEMVESIRRFIPDFEVEYAPDERQKIADSWPNSIDDSAARDEWDWEPKWDLDAMTEDMIKHLRERKENGTLYR